MPTTKRARAISEINLTSLVDVTLVLLIVFIITAPFMRAGVRVDLPEAEVRQSHRQQALLITVDSEKRVFVDSEEVPLTGIEEAVSGRKRQQPDLEVMIEGDTRLAYGTVIEVMDAVRRGGVEAVGLVLNPRAKR